MKGRDVSKVPRKSIFMLIPSSPLLTQRRHAVCPQGPAALDDLQCLLQGHWEHWHLNGRAGSAPLLGRCRISGG